MDVSRRTGSAHALQSALNVRIACLEVDVVSVTSVISQPIAAFLARLTTDPSLGSLVRQQCTLLPGILPDRALPASWPPWLTTAASTQGITRLTGSQQQALDLLHQGRHVCLMAPTGAGRGVVRLLAMYQSLAAEQRGHALYIFPSKLHTLAQSSAFAIWNAALAPEHRLSVAMYDGDTPGTERRAIKQALPRRAQRRHAAPHGRRCSGQLLGRLALHVQPGEQQRDFARAAAALHHVAQGRGHVVERQIFAGGDAP